MRGGWSSPTPYTPMDGENKAITIKKKKKKKKKRIQQKEKKKRPTNKTATRYGDGGHL